MTLLTKVCLIVQKSFPKTRIHKKVHVVPALQLNQVSVVVFIGVNINFTFRILRKN